MIVAYNSFYYKLLSTAMQELIIISHATKKDLKDSDVNEDST